MFGFFLGVAVFYSLVIGIPIYFMPKYEPKVLQLVMETDKDGKTIATWRYKNLKDFDQEQGDKPLAISDIKK